MINRQGFTLPEMIAVIAILVFLALLSVPFVRGYIEDAYNGKAKNYMRELYEARLNFERDFPGSTVVGNVNFDEIPTCDIDAIYEQTTPLAPSILVACKYIRVSTDVLERYTFAIGQNITDCSPADNYAVVMKGLNGRYSEGCAWITNSGDIEDDYDNEG